MMKNNNSPKGRDMKILQEMVRMNRLLIFLIITSNFFLTGCATRMATIPDINQTTERDFQLKGKIVYDGNREYLPKTITDDSASDNVLIFQYSYTVTYGRDNVPQMLPLFNPLTIVGFPIGENTLVVVGKLDVLNGKEVIKSYTSTCALEKTRSIFSEGETFSEIRRKGLLSVRDNIEAQLCRDRDFFSKINTSH